MPPNFGPCDENLPQKSPYHSPHSMAAHGSSTRSQLSSKCPQPTCSEVSCCEPTGPVGIPELLLNIPNPDQDPPSITQQVACGPGPCGNQLITLRYLKGVTTPCGNYSISLTVSWSPIWFSGIGDTLYFYYTVTNTGSATLAGDIEILDQNFGAFTIPDAVLKPGAYVNIRKSYTITAHDAEAHIVSTKAIAAVKVPCYPVVVYSNIALALVPQGTVDLSGVMTQELLNPGLITVLARVAITNSSLSHVAAENVRLVFPKPQYVANVIPRPAIPPASAITYDGTQVVIEIPSLPIGETYYFEWLWFSSPPDSQRSVTWSGTITTNSLPFPDSDLTVTSTWNPIPPLQPD